MGEILSQDEVSEDDLNLPKVSIDASRLLVIRTFLFDLPLGVGDIEASLRDAVAMFDIQKP